MKWIFLYLLIINLVGAFITVLDKLKARKNKWRIKEKTLFLLCAAGGCIGVYTAMRLSHHKTLHKRFMWGIPAIFVLQIIIIVFIVTQLSKTNILT